MKFIYNDGGRSKYFKGENVGDCVTRAIAIATGKDYKEVYDGLKDLAKKEKNGKRCEKSSVRDGVRKSTTKKYIEKVLGWKRVSTMRIGTTSRVHFVEDELPMGTLIVQLSHHLVCVKDKVIYDTYDSSKKEYYDTFGDLQVNNERLVYGYWVAPTKEEQDNHMKELEQEKVNKQLLEQKKLQEKKVKEVLKRNIEKIKDKYSKKIKPLQKKIRELEKLMNKEIEQLKGEGK